MEKLNSFSKESNEKCVSNIFKGFTKEDSVHAELVLTDGKTSIYNFREYGYQYGGLNGAGDYGSVYHHMLQEYTYSDEFIKFLVQSSLYCIILDCWRLKGKIEEVNKDLSVQIPNGIIKELNGHDNELLNQFIDNQVSYYKYDKASKECYEEEIKDCLLYDKEPYKIKVVNNKIIGSLWNGEQYEFPDVVREAVDLDKLILVRDSFVYVLFAYQLYNTYGINCPSEVIEKGHW